MVMPGLSNQIKLYTSIPFFYPVSIYRSSIHILFKSKHHKFMQLSALSNMFCDELTPVLISFDGLHYWILAPKVDHNGESVYTIPHLATQKESYVVENIF